MFGRAVLWPDVLDYCEEILVSEGPHTVNDKYYADPDIAAIQRRKAAEQMVRRDKQIAKTMGVMHTIVC